ncbi:DUF1353 domain-containing protein [Hellea sp.]|nr:DUF1353 domain-containing protein [Hellea sp.]
MRSTFTRPLHTGDVTRLEQGRPIRVITKPFEYHVGKFDSGNKVSVPLGYCSDGASVPRPLRWFLEPWGPYAQAAIVHDFLYSTWQRPRKEADEIFCEAIKVITEDSYNDGESSYKTPDYTKRGKIIALFAYWGVRVGGKFGYANGRKNYLKRAERALDKVKDRDKFLFHIIIDTPEALLLSAQDVDVS